MDVVRELDCRVGIVYGEDSAIVNKPTQRLMQATLGKWMPVVGLADAEHHLFLDQPVAFVGVLRTMVAEWQRSSTVRQASPLSLSLSLSLSRVRACICHYPGLHVLLAPLSSC